MNEKILMVIIIQKNKWYKYITDIYQKKKFLGINISLISEK